MGAGPSIGAGAGLSACAKDVSIGPSACVAGAGGSVAKPSAVKPSAGANTSMGVSPA